MGDYAAVVSKGALSILDSAKLPGLAEEFIARIVKARADDYVLKNRDLADIIRDNSMCTMLLTSFARSNGNTYLNFSLSDPLSGALKYLEKCEIDKSKFFKETEAEIDELIDVNRKNLQTVCEMIFSQIFDNQKRMPKALVRMCNFLDCVVGDIIAIRNQQGATSPKLPSPPVIKEEPPQPKEISISIPVPSLTVQNDSLDKLGDVSIVILQKPVTPETIEAIFDVKPVSNPTPTAAMAQKSLGILSIQQKVVGAFLFLRFFVPG